MCLVFDFKTAAAGLVRDEGSLEAPQHPLWRYGHRFNFNCVNNKAIEALRETIDVNSCFSAKNFYALPIHAARVWVA